jgi:hypothetical protein
MPPRRPLPIGFLLMGMLLATLGLGCAFVVLEPRSTLVPRALTALVALLSLLLVEALWWMRPWLVRAVDAWAATCIGSVLLASVLGLRGGLDPDALLLLAVAVLCFVGLPVVVVRWYVRDRARRLGLAPGLVP